MDDFNDEDLDTILRALDFAQLNQANGETKIWRDLARRVANILEGRMWGERQ